ncbi:hypothetical protein [Sphingobacterium sp. xlx-130]|uniref:hypothetical protein n=1 Tax=Sphingobacterium sp. xlx-130 TaxID=2654323 RepID=UPI0013D915C7|nr:hypothetical protein [Sphingobacterium sp. xlx-130]
MVGSKNVVEQYILTLEYYMNFYGLYSADIKHLLGGTTDFVKDTKAAVNGPTLKKLDAVSGLFGLTYYQFGDPDFALPKIENLPLATQERIAFRSEIGPPETKNYKKIDLKNEILRALTTFVGVKEFLPSNVYESLPKELQEKIGSATRVTGLFSNELKNNVKKTGNSVRKSSAGRPEEYYEIVSLELPKKVQKK